MAENSPKNTDEPENIKALIALHELCSMITQKAFEANDISRDALDMERHGQINWLLADIRLKSKKILELIEAKL